MGQNGLFQYYVEGECEKNLLRSLMHAKDADYLIRPGKIERLNPVTERISKEFLDKYFQGRKTAYAYRLGEIKTYDTPRELSFYGLKAAPQSFIYI